MNLKNIKDYIYKNAELLYYGVNEEAVDIVAKGLKFKNDKFGELFCPCVIVRDEDTVCPCNDFKRSDAKECHCKLYTKRTKSEVDPYKYDSSPHS